MEQRMNIPEEVITRLPLIKPEHINLYIKLREHEHSPIWNCNCGDRLVADDIPLIDSFSEKLYNHRKKGSLEVPDEIILWIEKFKDHVILFQENTSGLDLRKEFTRIPCMTRSDMAKSLERIVPDNASLDRLIVNPTSGTTGHPILAPNHPVSIGCYTPLLLFSLSQHGIKPVFTKDNVGCMLICAQKETIVYSTVVPMLNGTGFAKINLHPSSWKKEESSKLYIEDFSPLFLTGDPFSFSEMMNLDLKYKPTALVSTSTEMTPHLRKSLVKKYDTKVIDYYSLNETGPLAYSCPLHPDEFHVLPTDIFLEITDELGNQLPEHTLGEITVTGGRNPYLPLLRYKTGDRAKLKFEICECGDPMPRIYEMETRKPILFYTKKKALVNPIDISRIIKSYPINQFEFKQHKDLHCTLSVRKLHPFRSGDETIFKRELESLFQNEIDLVVDYDLDTSGKKPVAYKSEVDI